MIRCRSISGARSQDTVDIVALLFPRSVARSATWIKLIQVALDAAELA